MFSALFAFFFLFLYWRVLELKLLPPLSLLFVCLFTCFFSFTFFLLLSLTDSYLDRSCSACAQVVLSAFSQVPWVAFLSYLFIFVWSALFVSFKCFLSLSMIVGNFIDVYILGFIAVFTSSISYIVLFGLVFFSLFLFIFLSALLSFLLVLGLLELFSSSFQSITLSNRLSINMLCGCLLVSLLCSFIFVTVFLWAPVAYYLVLSFLCVIFLFEGFNSVVQFLIFNILGLEYLVI